MQKQPTAALLPVSVTRKAEREGGGGLEPGGGVKNVTKECSMMMSATSPTKTATPCAVRHGCQVDSCTGNKVVFRKQRLKAPSSSVELVLVLLRVYSGTCSGAYSGVYPGTYSGHLLRNLL